MGERGTIHYPVTFQLRHLSGVQLEERERGCFVRVVIQLSIELAKAKQISLGKFTTTSACCCFRRTAWAALGHVSQLLTGL